MEAHADLRTRYRSADGLKLEEFQSEIESFIVQGRETGAILDGYSERKDAQTILDYWLTILYETGQRDIDSTLLEFDPELAPELADEACPYKGLDAFGEDDSAAFFGRDRTVEAMLGKWKTGTAKVLLVTGGSGSGKSSTVMAGLLPKLREGAIEGSESWCFLEPIVPGDYPVESFEAALERAQGSGKTLMLVIDQFEELFTLCADPNERDLFEEKLMGFIEEGNALVATMRTDYRPYLARLDSLQALLEPMRIDVEPLGSTELRRAIEEPAAQIGLNFEEGLVEELLNDLVGEPTGLPLLQFTLMKLWDSRERNRVSLHTYRELGGGRRALANSADQLYQNLSPEKQMTVRRIFLQLIQPGEGLEMMRKRVKITHLTRYKEANAEEVLRTLIDGRLIRERKASEGPVLVEVVHEALGRNWPLLSDWLEEARYDLRRRAKFTTAAEEYQQMAEEHNWRDLDASVPISFTEIGKQIGHALVHSEMDQFRAHIRHGFTFARETLFGESRPDEPYLYRGAQLLEAERAIEAFEELTAAERRFLEACRNFREYEEAHNLAQKRAFTFLLGLVSGLLVIAALIIIYLVATS